MIWITILGSIVLPILFFGFKWWTKRTGIREGRSQVITENMEGEIQAHAKSNEARGDLHANRSLRDRMREVLRRRS